MANSGVVEPAKFFHGGGGVVDGLEPLGRGLQEFPAAVADEFLPRGVVVLDATHGDPGLGGDAAQGHALDPPLGDDGPHRLRYLPASHVVIHQFRHGTSIEVLTMHLHCQGNSANVLPWSQKFLQNPRHAPLAGNAVGC